MIRFLIAVALSLLPLAAQAQCNGESYWEVMSPEDRAALALKAANTPYPNGLIWRASKGGTELTIIGTMHIPDPRHDGLMARIRAPCSSTCPTTPI